MVFWTNTVIFLQGLFSPTSLIFLSFAAGIALWIFSGKRISRKIASRALFCASFALFIFFSYPIGTYLLVSPLEKSVAAINPLDYPDVNTVVVLGAGRGADIGRSPSATLGPVSTTRLVEGIRVFNISGAQNLILTGASRNHGSIAALMAQLAIDLGVDEHQIITIDNATNTRQEARFTSDFVRGDTVFLVSSAMHLRRAVKNFEREGVYAIPVATDFHVNPADSPDGIRMIFPSPQRILSCHAAVHEYLGLFWEIFRR